MTETELDLHFLRMTFDLARLARENGHPPFGAVIVEGNDILARATSTQTVLGDPTSHAEMNAVRLAQAAASRARLGKSTIYASSEPCSMCAAAIFCSGIGRIVFGFSEPRLRAVRNQTKELSGLAIGCREVLARAHRKITVCGPLIEDEAALVHEGFWTATEAAVAPRQASHSRSDHELFLRRAIALASQARKDDELPFGAIIVAGSGETLVEGRSTEVSDKDWTCHAETNAVRRVGKMASHAALGSATIYASSEPCAMCASAIYYSGIRRVVFGFPEQRLRTLLGSTEAAGLGFSCREILSRAAEPVEILGPVLEEEAGEPHSGYWTSRNNNA